MARKAEKGEGEAEGEEDIKNQETRPEEISRIQIYQGRESKERRRREVKKPRRGDGVGVLAVGESSRAVLGICPQEGKAKRKEKREKGKPKGKGMGKRLDHVYYHFAILLSDRLGDSPFLILVNTFISSSSASSPWSHYHASSSALMMSWIQLQDPDSSRNPGGERIFPGNYGHR